MFGRHPKHQHDWQLIDKTVVPPVQGKVISGEVWGYSEAFIVKRDKLMLRVAQGYVVLTFRCDCGEYQIEER